MGWQFPVLLGVVKNVHVTAGPVIPGTRKPNREQIVRPDEPDDDDL
ncbi:hypothetical protein [Nocardia sp. NPDC004604]